MDVIYNLEVDVTKQVKLYLKFGKGLFIELFHEDNLIGFLDNDGITLNNKRFKCVVTDNGSFNIFKMFKNITYDDIKFISINYTGWKEHKYGRKNRTFNKVR